MCNNSRLLRFFILLTIQALIHFGGYKMAFSILGCAFAWALCEIILIKMENALKQNQ